MTIAIRGLLRLVLLADCEDAIRGTAAEFRHVGASIASRPDVLGAFTEIIREPDSVLVVSSDLTERPLEDVLALAVALCDRQVLFGLGARADDALIKTAFAAGVASTIALPLTPDRVKRLSQSLPVLTDRDVEHGDRFAIGDLIVDGPRHQVTWRGEPVEVTLREFMLLQRVARAYPYFATLDELAREYVSTGGSGDPYRAIRVLMHRLRARLTRTIGDTLLTIETVRGVGYRMSYAA